MATDDQAAWGRVDETGTVFVRDGDSERAVGQYPDGTADEALAYFERKFTELAGQVALLEQRIKRGTAPSDVAKTVASLTATVSTANAVGDLASLLSRLEALGGAVEELTDKQAAETRAALATALLEREAIVTEAEALAAQDPATIQWKQTTASLDELFARWQKHQTEGPKLPKTESNELWKRFKAARATLETHRRAFFAELDSVHKDAKNRKQDLVEQAEALAASGTAGIPTYRGLLDQWKAAGRAGKKFDDALWARFKAAGDLLYAAKADVDAQENIEYGANLEQKLALLTEAEPLLTESDRTKARTALAAIQRRWDAIGKVPRDKVKAIEDRMRTIEAAVRKLDEEHWHKSNPERIARAEGLAGQLQDAIAKLQAELAAAQASRDARRIAEAQEALDARKSWLKAIS
ncbi:DUF349 domain-containing protein [soil metagenome]